MSDEFTAEQVESARRMTGDIMEAARFAVSPVGVLRREDLEIALASELLAKADEIARLRAENAALRAELAALRGRQAWDAAKLTQREAEDDLRRHQREMEQHVAAVFAAMRAGLMGVP